MLPTQHGAFRLFRLWGIDVFLHFSWFIVAVYEIQARAKSYASPVWNVAEYLALFGIVLMHEFGHALACRQVGGVANQIVLWPLGGVAYVSPPQRPGAVLWSIAAGPLVNVALVPALFGLTLAADSLGWGDTAPDMSLLIQNVWKINLGLLIFNMMPVYPLDGGQILQALLWFAVGRARSLMVASFIGVIGGLGLIGLAIWLYGTGHVGQKDLFWIGLIGLFILSRCWIGIRQAGALSALAKIPRRDGFACPSCGAAPMQGRLWVCSSCRQPFDTFETGAVCPNCHTQFSSTKCPECLQSHPIGEWKT
jgi:Zn-dependent protease